MSLTESASLSRVLWQYSHTAITEAAERNDTAAPQLGQETVCIVTGRLADELFQDFGLGAVVVGLRDEALIEQALECLQPRLGRFGCCSGRGCGGSGATGLCGAQAVGH